MAKRGRKEIWTEEKCYDEARKYTIKGDFIKQAPGAYQKACLYGWMEDYTWLKRKKKHNVVWTEENTMKEAKKYRTRTEFHHGNLNAYRAAIKAGWIDSYHWFTRKQENQSPTN